MSFRMSLKALLMLDASSVAFFFLLAILFPAARYGNAYMVCIFLVAMPLHALIAPFKGLDFVIWDAPPDSLVKYYSFFVILVATGGGKALLDALWVYFEWCHCLIPRLELPLIKPLLFLLS